MFTRNETSWTSIFKSKIWLPAIAISLMAGTAQAQWTLVDNFDGLTAGDFVQDTTGPGCVWDGNATFDPATGALLSGATNSAEVDPDDAGNLAMRIEGTPSSNTGALRAQLDAADQIASGDTGTLFWRFRTAVGANSGSDTVFGLTSNNADTAFNFKSGLRYTVPDFVPPAPSAGALFNMDVRNGGSYESVASGLADNTWYKMWMVSNNDAVAGTWDLYVQSDTDSNYATQTQVGTNVAYRTGQSNPTAILAVYFRNANNVNGVQGNDLYYDDVYINSTAQDLTDPLAMTTVCGDVNLDGTVSFLDIQPFIAILSSGGFQAEADCDGNGAVNFLDIQGFIAALSGP